MILVSGVPADATPSSGLIVRPTSASGSPSAADWGSCYLVGPADIHFCCSGVECLGPGPGFYLCRWPPACPPLPLVPTCGLFCCWLLLCFFCDIWEPSLVCTVLHFSSSLCLFSHCFCSSPVSYTLTTHSVFKVKISKIFMKINICYVTIYH